MPTSHSSKIVFILKSRPEELSPFREKLRALLQNENLTEAVRENILVAIGEACTNAIRHAYKEKPGHKILLTVESQKDCLVFRVRDFGEKIDPSRIKPPQLPATRGGGLGIYFMKEMMDKVEYNMRRRRGNELILTKFRPKSQ